MEIELEDFEDVDDVDEGILFLEDPSYSHVYWRHLKRNRACRIARCTEGWKAAREWAVRPPRRGPDYEALLREYGDSVVPVAASPASDPERRCVTKMPLADYVRYCESLPSARTDVDYLKDWHLRRERPHDRFYRVPSYFASDWLNERALDLGEDDFMFVYVGAAGSWTPLHRDVYSSFSWSVNVVGKKRWLFLPPGEELKLLDRSGNLPVEEDLKIRLDSSVRYYELVQDCGDAVFVPSGWHHQVHNLEDTISVNHNWINACNVKHVWCALLDHLKLVEKEIAEHRAEEGWSEHCQLMLKASHGMDAKQFVELVSHVAEKRIDFLKGERGPVSFDGWSFGVKHVEYDLKTIRDLLGEMIGDERSRSLVDCDAVKALSERIRGALN